MKVRVSITLDIDPAAWEQVYGIEGAEAIRADVKDWATHFLHEGARQNDVLVED